MDRITAAAERGAAWITAQQRADGSFCDPDDGVGGYYKVPTALSLARRHRKAYRLLDWVTTHHFTTDGDFRATRRKAHEPAHDAWPVYSNAWLIQGAHRLGRRDISMRGAEFLLHGQTLSGGFYAYDGAVPYLEPVCTSWGGLALLTTGHVNPARLSGDLLARMVADQPDPGRFYFRMDAAGTLATDVPAGAQLSYFVDASRRGQIYYNPGIALIFLMHLYRETEDKSYLQTSQEIFSFTERCADDVYRFPPSGKLGVGCALLHAETGEPAARAAALRVAEYLVEIQTGDGYWRLPDEPLYAGLRDRDGFEVRLDVTAEFTAFLLEIASEISPT